MKQLDPATLYLRQLGLVSPEVLAGVPIIVIGAGGIGSPAVLGLAKMGLTNITVYDDDVVDTHNLPNQFYRLADIGRPKVEALRDIVLAFTGTEIKARNERFTNQPVSGVVISAIDSLKTRREIWDSTIRMNTDVDLYIDGRMGGVQFYLYSIRPHDPDDIDFYERITDPSRPVAEIPCSERSIIFTLLGIASEIGCVVFSHAVRRPFKRAIERDLPSGWLNGKFPAESAG